MTFVVLLKKGLTFYNVFLKSYEMTFLLTLYSTQISGLFNSYADIKNLKFEKGLFKT